MAAQEEPQICDYSIRLEYDPLFVLPYSMKVSRRKNPSTLRYQLLEPGSDPYFFGGSYQTAEAAWRAGLAVIVGDLHRTELGLSTSSIELVGGGWPTRPPSSSSHATTTNPLPAADDPQFGVLLLQAEKAKEAARQAQAEKKQQQQNRARYHVDRSKCG